MKKFVSLLLPLLLLLSLPASAQQAYTEGTHYKVISAQKTASNEVREYFWYGCSHCFRAQSGFQSVRQSLPKGTSYKITPAIWNKPMEMHAKAFYAAEALSVTAAVHPALYNSMNMERSKLASAQQIYAVFQKHGVSSTEFGKVFNSFGVKSNVMKAQSAFHSERVTGVPALTVNGKYQVINAANYEAGQLSALLKYLLRLN